MQKPANYAGATSGGTMLDITGRKLDTTTRLQSTSAIPVSGECDVLVAGGGIAGFAAAVASARGGARTVLVEPRNAIGGNAAQGLHLLGFHTINGLRAAAGIAEELVGRLKHYGAATDIVPDCRICSFAVVEPGWLKIIAFQMLESSGVDVQFHTAVTDVLMDGERIRGAVLNGKRAILCRSVVDATGDGTVAALADAPFEVGADNDGWPQPSSLFMRIGGVDVERCRKVIVEEEQQVFHREFLASQGIDHTGMAPYREGPYNANAFLDRVVKAKEDGVLPKTMVQERVIFETLIPPGEVIALQAKVIGKNAADERQLSLAQAEATRQVIPVMNFFKRYIPGFESSHLIDIAPFLGVRETRRVLGDHFLTDVDILSDTRFDDAIGLGAYYLDVHPPRGGDKTVDSMQYPLEPYQLPYRMLLPRNVEGLLITGRCVSCNQRAFGAIRIIPTCMVLGQAAGTAAAIAATNRTTPRDIDVAKLQQTLDESGALLRPGQADGKFEIPAIAP